MNEHNLETLDSEPNNAENFEFPNEPQPTEVTPTVFTEQVNEKDASEIVTIQNKITDILQSKSIDQTPTETVRVITSTAETESDLTMLDRFPTLTRWAKRLIFIAGMTAAGVPLANAADKGYSGDEQKQEQVIKDPQGRVVGIARTQGKNSPIVSGVQGDVSITNGAVNITPHKDTPRSAQERQRMWEEFTHAQPNGEASVTSHRDTHRSAQERQRMWKEFTHAETNHNSNTSEDISVTTHQDNSPVITGVGGKVIINGVEVPH